MKLSRSINEIPFSGVSSIIKKAVAENWTDALHFAGGEPKFPTPANLLKYFKPEYLDKITKYSMFDGDSLLIEKIITKLKVINNITATPNDVFVTSGGSCSLFYSLKSVVDYGEDVLIQSPCWEHYSNIIKVVGGNPVSFDMNRDEKGNFRIDKENIERKLSSKTKAILVNSPLNPTGEVLSIAEINILKDICSANKIALISDEEYETFVFDNIKHNAVRAVYPDAISLFSFSKSFALTGIRLGYIVSNPMVSEALRKVSLYTNMYAPSPSQYIAISVLEENFFEYLSTVKTHYENKRNEVISLLSNIDFVKINPPEGGVYVFPELQLPNSQELIHQLISKHHVLVVPGEFYGDNLKQSFRLFIGNENKNSYKQLIERINKLKYS